MVGTVAAGVGVGWGGGAGHSASGAGETEICLRKSRKLPQITDV